MINEIDRTPKALRLHIGVFGRTNAGKSTLINAISGQKIAITSPVAGTTTDPVFKPMEIIPLGPVVFIDTAGLDDKSELGEVRKKKSLQQLTTCDAVILVISAKTQDFDEEDKYIKAFKKEGVPVIIIVNTFGMDVDKEKYKGFANEIVYINLENDDIAPVKNELINLLKNKEVEVPLTADLIKAGDLVILTAPQDIQAPKGRLILPEVMVLRDLLDNKAIVMTVTADNIKQAFDSLKIKPALVVTDSQIFRLVNDSIPKDVRLTSFSLLMAKIKADLPKLVEDAKVIGTLQDGDKVVILESCAHHPLENDIAREQLPMLLKKYTGKDIKTEVISGQVTPDDLAEYKLAIHCGGCMVNRKSMLNKQKRFEQAGIPMTNFGAAIAFMNHMLDRVVY